MRSGYNLISSHIRDHIESFGYYNALIGGLLEHCNIINFTDFESESDFIEITEKIIKDFKTPQRLKDFQIVWDL